MSTGLATKVERSASLSGFARRVDLGHIVCRDRGSGTVLGLAASAVLMVAALLAWTITAGVAAHQRASVAADLAALAAARGADGPDCAVAQRVALANAAALDSCAVEGADVLVRVSVAPPTLVVRLAALAGQSAGRFVATSRAGPR